MDIKREKGEVLVQGEAAFERKTAAAQTCYMLACVWEEDGTERLVSVYERLRTERKKRNEPGITVCVNLLFISCYDLS